MKDIVGYEGLYAVTSCGRVWSYRRQKFLRPCDNGHGYLIIDLCKDGVKKHFRVNRLVAEAYIPNPEGLPQVGHRDEVRYNNSVNNLYWTSSKDNCNYGTRNAKISKALSKPVYCVELDQVFDSITKAAEAVGVQATSITLCCQGKTKTCKRMHWQYVKK